jgi:hypothetical protein
MITICRNCSQHCKGHFCNNCGQSTETQEINFHFLWHDIQHGLLHFDNGIFYTIKQLFTQPGHTIRAFIDGKRVRHFKPLSLVIILATIYGLLYHNFHIDIAGEFQRNRSVEEIKLYEKFNSWLSSHYSWATLLLLPVYALSSFIAFKKQYRNFVEHLVLNAFLAGQRLVFHIIAFPLLYIYNGTPALGIITGALSIADFLLLFWGYAQFFDKIKKAKAFFLTLLSYILSIVTLLVIVIILTIIVFILKGK